MDPDILVPKVNDKRIRFSRRSTATRYIFRTPWDAANYIHAVDDMVETGNVPEDFMLILTDQDLISARPRSQGNPQQAAWQIQSKGETVLVENGQITVQPAHKPEKKPKRPPRVNHATAQALRAAS